MKFRVSALAGLILAALLGGCQRQADKVVFYRGVDLSYVNEMEDCGAVYREAGQPRDPFELFHDHGANLVRARLWHSPDWTDYSTLADVRKTFARAREAGMRTLLDIHYSDDWADPGKQRIPEDWEQIDDEDALAQAVYQYTYDVLADLHAADLAPDFVQIGNETNAGMLKSVMKLDWSRDAKIFEAGLQAVRDINAEKHTSTRTILHVAQPENAGGWFREAREAGLTDFDVIGLSYYPQWSSISLSDVGGQVSTLRQTFGKDVMIIETAYPWTFEAVPESADNILTKGVSGYPATVDGQRRFLTDLTQGLINNGALGVVYWEPAWVSTGCKTRWGQGSHWENATFFDFQNGNELHAGIDFLSHDYVFPAALPDGVLEEAYGAALVEDAVGDVLDGDPALDLLSLHVTDDASSVRIGLTIAGDILDGVGNSYMLFIDTSGDSRGAGQDVGQRPITVADPFKPEYRLDVRIVKEKGTIGGSYSLYAWDGNAWAEITFSGGAAIHGGLPSIVELYIPKAALGDPQMLNIGVVSTDRSRIHTAADILGTDVSPKDWDEQVVIDSFGSYEVKFKPGSALGSGS